MEKLVETDDADFAKIAFQLYRLFVTYSSVLWCWWLKGNPAEPVSSAAATIATNPNRHPADN